MREMIFKAYNYVFYNDGTYESHVRGRTTPYSHSWFVVAGTVVDALELPFGELVQRCYQSYLAKLILGSE